MAHWIIEDHGFGGTLYRCSECRESWNDIFQDVSMECRCPNCGSPINDDETEYVDKKHDYLYAIESSELTATTSLREYCELEYKLFQLTGFNLEKLVELFAAGYTLKTPEYKSLNDVLGDVTC